MSGRPASPGGGRLRAIALSAVVAIGLAALTIASLKAYGDPAIAMSADLLISLCR
ncbi:MAG: hypothetical protein RID91_03180 [Azospirillaceae bacterium]